MTDVQYDKVVNRIVDEVLSRYEAGDIQHPDEIRWAARNEASGYAQMYQFDEQDLYNSAIDKLQRVL